MQILKRRTKIDRCPPQETRERANKIQHKKKQKLKRKSIKSKIGNQRENQQPKMWFFKKMNKCNKVLARLRKKKKRRRRQKLLISK